LRAIKAPIRLAPTIPIGSKTEDAMSANAATLILVADGGRVRGFVEQRRHGPLRESAEWARTAPADERRGHGRGGGTTISPGSGRSNVHEASPADAAETKFLEELAHDLERAALMDGFEHFVLIAPPRALGVLRGALGPRARLRVEASEPHDRLTETADAIRARLRAVRVPAA
jgi:protein required for attachment to host cells